MKFSPIKTSEVIAEKYKRYLKTIFQISDPDYEEQFIKALAERNILAKGPYLDAVDTFKKGKSLRQLTDEGTVSRKMEKLNFPKDRTLYLHQEKAIRKAKEGKNLVVSTGTGSGKTESFLIGGSICLKMKEDGSKETFICIQRSLTAISIPSVRVRNTGRPDMTS